MLDRIDKPRDSIFPAAASAGTLTMTGEWCEIERDAAIGAVPGTVGAPQGGGTLKIDDGLVANQDSLLIIGDRRDNILSGDDGNDVLDGRRGDDLMSGGAGSDLLLSGNGNDVLNGEFGDDYLRDGSGKDAIFGGPGSDTLQGGRGSDQLSLMRTD